MPSKCQALAGFRPQFWEKKEMGYICTPASELKSTACPAQSKFLEALSPSHVKHPNLGYRFTVLGFTEWPRKEAGLEGCWQ